MTVRLAVAGAFHTEFMQPAVEKLQAALAQTEVRYIQGLLLGKFSGDGALS
jgi:acyl transferase domain-containing protein